MFFGITVSWIVGDFEHLVCVSGQLFHNPSINVPVKQDEVAVYGSGRREASGKHAGLQMLNEPTVFLRWDGYFL
ncbi:MAG: hypothetical protein C0403_11120 [Desulfobacterium sp.]|nr:hypothetical protein [Desulfobacterium sp.]